MSLLQYVDKKPNNGSVTVTDLVNRIRKIPSVVNISKANLPSDNVLSGQYGFVILLDNSNDYVIKFFDPSKTRSPMILNSYNSFRQYKSHNPKHLVKIGAYGNVKNKNLSYFVMERLSPISTLDEVMINTFRKILVAYKMFNELSGNNVTYLMSFRESIESFGSIDNFIKSVEDNEAVFMKQYETFKDDTLESFIIFSQNMAVKRKLLVHIYKGLVEYYNIFDMDYDDIHANNIMLDKTTNTYKIIDLN